MGKESFQKITGVLPFTGGVSITNILWMMENLPGVITKTHKMGHLNTYIYKRLTGCWATDPTNASMMGLYETTSWGGWSGEICSAFNISRDKLPDIYPAGTVLGGLRSEAARITGLKEGIPVVLGSNDAATAQIGAGNTRAGDILNISGSSEMISIISDKPVVNDRYYLRNAITPGKWQVYATTVGGFAIDWFRKEFFREMDRDVFFNEYLPELVLARLNKSTVKFLPYLAGDRQSLKKKRGGFSGLTLDSSREDLLVAILHGTHEPIIRTIDISRRFIELSKTIKLTGGLIERAYMELKRKKFSGFDLEVIDNAPIHGNGRLALEALESM
jgi:sugar (pentulose or hexulose) kinase